MDQTWVTNGHDGYSPPVILWFTKVICTKDKMISFTKLTRGTKPFAKLQGTTTSAFLKTTASPHAVTAAVGSTPIASTGSQAQSVSSAREALDAMSVGGS